MSSNTSIIPDPNGNRGMFPYQCPLCGGASQRCGVFPESNNEMEGESDSDNWPHDHHCGKYCWEDDVIYLYQNQYRRGIYSGYGYAIDLVDIDLQVSTYYFNVIWKLNVPFYQQRPECNQLVNDFYCVTCFEKYLLPGLREEEAQFQEWCQYYPYYYDIQENIRSFLHYDISLL